MEKEEGRESIIGAVSVNGEVEGKLGGEVEKEEDEEEKIDKFYALIRNFREERNRLRNELIISNNDDDQLEMVRKKNKRKYWNESSSWTPTFELEDFKQDYFIKKPLQIFPPPPPPPPCKKQEEDRDENGLDLKLTL